MSDLDSDFEVENQDTSEEEISGSDSDSDEGNTSILIDSFDSIVVSLCESCLLMLLDENEFEFTWVLVLFILQSADYTSDQLITENS